MTEAAARRQRLRSPLVDRDDEKAGQHRLGRRQGGGVDQFKFERRFAHEHGLLEGRQPRVRRACVASRCETLDVKVEGLAEIRPVDDGTGQLCVLNVSTPECRRLNPTWAQVKYRATSAPSPPTALSRLPRTSFPAFTNSTEFVITASGTKSREERRRRAR